MGIAPEASDTSRLAAGRGPDHAAPMLARSAHLALVLMTLSACEARIESTPDAALGADLTRTDASELDLGFGVDALGPERADPDAGTSDSTPADAGEPDCQSLASSGSDHALYDELLDCLTRSELTDEDKDQLVREFIDRVEAQDGFPIRRPGGGFIFAYLRTPELDAEDDREAQEDFDPTHRLEPIRVAFDLTDLNANAEALEPRHRDFYSAEVSLPSPEGQRYRFVAKDDQGRDWFYSDPLSRRFEFDLNGRFSLVRGAGDVAHLEWIRRVHAAQLNVDRSIYVYVPPGYDLGTDAYSVLYMHDGNNLFDPALPRSAPAGTWNVHGVMSQQLQGGHVRPGLIVGIPNTDARFDEYTHVPDDIGEVVGGRADEYADFIVSDLKPMIDARYRTRPDRVNTGVMGSSLGGLVSFHIGLRHPTVFGFVGGLSSTFIWGRVGLANETMLERYRATSGLAAQNQIFYLDSGGGPNPTCPDGRDNYCEALEMRDLLVAAGIDRFPLDPDASPLSANTNIMHWWTPNAPHNEGAWSARVHRPLRLFFRPE